MEIVLQPTTDAKGFQCSLCGYWHKGDAVMLTLGFGTSRVCFQCMTGDRSRSAWHCRATASSLRGQADWLDSVATVLLNGEGLPTTAALDVFRNKVSTAMIEGKAAPLPICYEIEVPRG